MRQPFGNCIAEARFAVVCDRSELPDKRFGRIGYNAGHACPTQHIHVIEVVSNSKRRGGIQLKVVTDPLGGV